MLSFLSSKVSAARQIVSQAVSPEPLNNDTFTETNAYGFVQKRLVRDGPVTKYGR